MLFEVLQDETGKFYAEETAGWRNNPGCVELLNVKTGAEAARIVEGMNAAAGGGAPSVPAVPQAPVHEEAPALEAALEESAPKGKRRQGA
jgi:hypothetical protein